MKHVNEYDEADSDSLHGNYVMQNNAFDEGTGPIYPAYDAPLPTGSLFGPTDLPSNRSASSQTGRRARQHSFPADLPDSGSPTGGVGASEADGDFLPDNVSRKSWYTPARRRAGEGTHRRNRVVNRRVDLANPADSAPIRSRTPSSNSSSNSWTTANANVTFRDASALDQLFAVLDRSFRQLWGKKLLLALDILVPIVFVLITVVLWSIWGSTEEPETTYVNYEEPPVSPDFYAWFLCYDPNGPPVPGFLQCDPDSEYVCPEYDYSLVPFPPNSLCETTPTAAPLRYVVITYLQRSLGTLSVVMPLDTVIMFQFLALLAYSDRDFKTLVDSALSSLVEPTRYSAIMCSGKMLFVGDRAQVLPLVSYINDTSAFFHYVYNENQLFATLEEARDSIRDGDRLWMIVEARSLTRDNFDVVLHMNNSALPAFGTTVNPAYPGGLQYNTAELYYVSGFLTMQQLISEYYMNRVYDAGMEITNMIASMGCPSFLRIPLLVEARQVVPLMLTLAYLYGVAQQCRKIVAEREQRLREAMLIMGLKQWTLYLSDFIVQVAVLFVVAIVSVLILKLTYVTKSDVWVMFLLYILYSLTTIPLAGLIAAFFDKARLAALVAPVVFFILVVPMFAITNARGAAVIGFSILSPSGFASALNILLNHETGTGFHPDQFSDPSDNPTLAVVVGMLAADFFLYYLLMLYFDAVLPREWGTPKHPLFFIIDPFRACCGGTEKRLYGGPDGRAEDGVFEDDSYEDDVVQMDGLRKEYKRDGKKFTAVNNLYWGMREGEISVLLGHNGAGKTTVLNMMTGMIEPDEGDCYVYGLSVRQECAKVRREIGFCPQHNILWPELTCRDHLNFFGRIKGLKGWELEDAMCRMLYETDLLEKMDQPAGSLSGGQKRKLSISIAFVGDSRLVFLDEPTAGLDVAARRHTWELLKRMAQSRTIMLTTHYMDEADLLGQRIGIMSLGRLKCSGSSMFLKSRLGVGYSITISIDPEIDPEDVDELVLSEVDNSDILGHNGCELTYRLPAASVDQFPGLLDSIEDESEDLGIRGYSLAATTLEEVFLKVSEEDITGRLEAKSEDDVQRVWDCSIQDGVCGTQMRAMFVKRFWNALRDRRMQCFQIVCPVLCVLIAMLLNLINFRDPQSLEISYAMFTNEPPATVISAQCDLVWGSNVAIPDATNMETHYADALNVSEYMLDTWREHADPRLGAIACGDETCFYMNGIFIPLQRTNVMLYNTTSKHQAPLNMRTYYEQFLRYYSGVQTATMKWTAAFLDTPSAPTGITSIFVGALIMIPFTFLPSNPVAWIVKERECGARHQQDIAGLNFYVYWFCNFVFDLAAYFVSMLLCIAIFAIFNRPEFIGLDRVGGTFAIFAVYGFTSTVAAYALSFLFKDHATAQTVVMGVSFVLGFLLLMIVYVLQLNEDSVDTSDTLRWIFRIIPTYCIGEGIINLLMLDANIMTGNARSVWDMDQLGWSLVYLAAEFPVFSFLALFIDHPTRRKWWGKLSYNRNGKPDIPPDEDSDVEDERLAVYEAASATDSSDVVRVVDLRKMYENGKVAVKGITFSIFPGEVFGFLGTNGAGKTTSISILCQSFLPTSGSANICGYDLVDESAEALQCIGYCPQFDATLDLLTVEEHINLYSALRGIVPEERPAVLEALLVLCELTTYRKTLAAKLSGGNRRKLSVATSLVGGPRVVLLDEPSAGMDPVARRGMWTAIQRAAKHCSVVLTTHHLEEVEALADIVAIMVDGTLRCIGDKVHLKNKYGTGFEVNIRVATPDYKDAVSEFVEATFPGAFLNESDERRLVYQFPREAAFADIFEIIQANKAALQITDYSVSQTSIEQIFLRISGEDA